MSYYILSLLFNTMILTVMMKKKSERQKIEHRYFLEFVELVKYFKDADKNWDGEKIKCI